MTCPSLVRAEKLVNGGTPVDRSGITLTVQAPAGACPARAATQELQPLISQYTTKFFRWVKIALVLAVVLAVGYVIFQAIAQQSIVDWILDRFEDDEGSSAAVAWATRR